MITRLTMLRRDPCVVLTLNRDSRFTMKWYIVRITVLSLSLAIIKGGVVAKSIEPMKLRNYKAMSRMSTEAAGAVRFMTVCGIMAGSSKRNQIGNGIERPLRSNILVQRNNHLALKNNRM